MQMKRYFSFIIFILIIVSISFSGCGLGNDFNKPMLKVITETRGSWINAGTKHYYAIYDNGTIEATEKFEATKTEIHDLYKIEERLKADSTKADDIPIYSSEIIEIINKMENSLVGKYFIVNDRYFFSTTISETPAKDYASSLFEYFPNDNNFKKITDFQDTYITNLEIIS